MRITTDTLLRLANDWIKQRVQTDRNVVAVFLHGSLLSGSPDLGGAVDIDLFVIRLDEHKPAHEIQRITEDIHLDIVFQARDLYRSTRNLRLDPWLGPVINGCKILHDPQHFLDFIQAGVRAQFDRPENVLRRAKQRLEKARNAWLQFHLQPPENDPAGFDTYLVAVEHAANAIALLSGPCLTERRFLPQFTAGAAAIDRPGLLAGLMGLIGGVQVSADALKSWLPEWQHALERVPDGAMPTRLHPYRFNYYFRAFEHYLSDENTARMALWPLLRTWTDIAMHLPVAETWQEAVTQLGWTVEEIPTRLDALDAFLDTIDEALESWGESRGAV